ncbi:hypothetical protein ACER0C_001070 [Sarotherodon galilaeus]
MNVQVCHCGWTKRTTYHGLRVHQGMKGCTPKGMRIPQSEQSRFSHKPSYNEPQIKIEEPFEDHFKSSVFETPQRSHQTTELEDSRARQVLDFSIGGQQTPNLSDMNVQVCHCGWTKYTTYHGLRVHQGKMGCTPKGMRIPQSEQSRFFHKPSYNEPQIKIEEPFEDHFKSYGEKHLISILCQSSFIKIITFNDVCTHIQASLLTGLNDSNWKNVHFIFTRLTSDFTALLFTPQRSHQSTVSSDKARRALDFSTGEQQRRAECGESSSSHSGASRYGGAQVVQILEFPGKAAQHAAIGPKEKEKEIDKLKEKKTKKLQKAKQEKIKSDLQQKIHIRELKMAEVRSLEIDCKGSLDVEWLEVNNFFSEVIRVVEDARKKALKPLEERRQKVKEDAQDIIQKLQREIDVLKNAIAEAPKNPDLEVSPLTGLNESTDWKNVQVDTSLSFGTLRTTTSAMMKQIHEEMEKLSSIELRRITKFAVDVKLDPTTAHQSLEIYGNGKKVRDGGKMSKDPDSSQRFDVSGSILGLNRLSSGRAYWEVEVRNKTGWDLGVARCDANRKGKLSINPDNGYWATVHYEDQKYAALMTPPMSLSLKGKPQKVGVFVDYEEGLVSFYDVTSQSHIYSFTECSFGGEILPYFSPHLKQNEKNTNPLIISAVQKQQ